MSPKMKLMLFYLNRDSFFHTYSLVTYSECEESRIASTKYIAVVVILYTKVSIIKVFDWFLKLAHKDKLSQSIGED